MLNVDYERFGVRVRQQREQKNLTQNQLARKAGVTASFIGHIERGEKKASVDTLVALCNAMAISPSLLLEDSLSDEAMNSQLAFDKENQDLMKGIMHVVREFNLRNEYR